jgi:hypothetical protein
MCKLLQKFYKNYRGLSDPQRDYCKILNSIYSQELPTQNLQANKADFCINRKPYWKVSNNRFLNFLGHSRVPRHSPKSYMNIAHVEKLQKFILVFPRITR